MHDASHHPSRRALALTWALLAGLTVGSMATALADGDAVSTAALAGTQVALILALTAVKARQILHVYLNLRTSTGGWRVLFTAFVLAILGVVLGGHLLVGVV
ncbi:cytochrome C oxidase subunit IV family protein [Caenispirillum salinarum]|uniref:cytochrome C oxidase subunit IV family protein n=1 Tax=Caenispirillum salinarum TaxID=859058 RepID=UPI00384A5FA7